MKDAFGSVLSPGDLVVTVTPYYRGLVKGVVEHKNPKGSITVRTLKENQALIRGSSEVYKVPPEPPVDY